MNPLPLPTEGQPAIHEKETTRMRKAVHKHLLTCIALVMMLSLPMLSFGKETAQSWELVNPQGIVKVEPMKVNPHPATLEGKTVVLRWNGKHNGNNILDRVAEMLSEQIKDITIVKLWEKYPDTVCVSSGQEKSKDIAKKVASFKPDLVIASQTD